MLLESIKKSIHHQGQDFKRLSTNKIRKMDDIAIGIDLGTTNSCVSLYMNGTKRILENEAGGRITPSFIYFRPEGGIVIGEHAKKMAAQRPENGVYEIKRLVGRRYDDSQLQGSLKYFPFDVSRDSSNLPVVSVKQKGSVARKTPQELYTSLLQELKKYTEEKLRQSIDKLVITVPAYFNVTQREVTLAAAKAAGFTVLKLLNEPTAAALAYYFDNDIEGTHCSLVYDLGGGTFDVAVLEKRLDNTHVVAVAGDTQLGGHDFDTCILDYVFQVLRDKYKYDPKDDSDDKRRLRNKCEEAKRELSSVEETLIIINGMVPAHPKIKITITRSQFEKMTEKFFQKTIDIVDNCLRSSKISKQSIDEVILCGGSTRIPKIQEMVSGYFGKEKINKFVNPDECVAEGAALQAAMLSTHKKQKIENLEMIDVVPLSLGFDSFGHKMVFLIKRNTKIPATASQTYVNSSSTETTMILRIAEGERSDFNKNRFLGTIEITGLTQAPPRQRDTIAILSIDHNGILTATVKEKLGSKSKELKVNYTRGDRSEHEIKNSLMDAMENKKYDERFVKFVGHKRYLNDYCESVLYNLKNLNLTETYSEIYDFCKRTEELCDFIEMDEESRVKQLIKECHLKCKSIVEENNFEFMPLPISE